MKRKKEKKRENVITSRIADFGLWQYEIADVMDVISTKFQSGFGLLIASYVIQSYLISYNPIILITVFIALIFLLIILRISLAIKAENIHSSSPISLILKYLNSVLVIFAYLLINVLGAITLTSNSTPMFLLFVQFFWDTISHFTGIWKLKLKTTTNENGKM